MKKKRRKHLHALKHKGEVIKETPEGNMSHLCYLDLTPSTAIEAIIAMTRGTGTRKHHTDNDKYKGKVINWNPAGK